MAYREAIAIVATVVAALSLASCAPSVTHPSSTPSAPLTPSAQPTVPPSPSATPSVPVGFQPEALSSISESDFWVLGTTACAGAGCPQEILHTVDGGSSFHRIPTPPLGAVLGTGPPSAGLLRFADASDGWVFGDALWSTHDAGTVWHHINPGGSLFFVPQVEPGANGFVYAVFEVCANPTTASGCAYHVMRSRASSDTWSVISPPGNPAGQPIIGVHGNTLWVMYFGGFPGVEWTSHDDGVLWVRGSMPCTPELDGSFDPVSTSVIWAFCATGNSGGPWVSTNGGATYTSAEDVGQFSNAGVVAAVSATHAFLCGAESVFSVTTTDGGGSYQPIPELVGAQWIGFTDTEVGYAITSVNAAMRLWRTTNAGGDWSLVALP